MFSAALYIGQSIGVAAGSLVIDRTGAGAIFLAAAHLVPLLGFWFAWLLRRRAA
jgi:predicted MFS family arabinose efflux permease